MKKVTKKMLAVACCAVMATSAVGTLAACSGDKDVKEFTVFAQTDNDIEVANGDNPVMLHWQEQTGVKLTWNQPSKGTENDVFNMMVAGGNYTDIIDISVKGNYSLETLHKDGVVQNIAPYITPEIMPNYYAYLNDPAHKDIKNALYHADGKMYTLAIVEENPELFGSLVYRHDILVEQTNNNVQFPSGNAEPTTFEDIEYMLPLFKAYFEKHGKQDYGCIAMANPGYYSYGELTSSFGVANVYVENGEVKVGFEQEGFYDYMVQMREWFSNGYINPNFVTDEGGSMMSPNDPCVNLVHEGRAGIWWGLADEAGNLLAEYPGVPDTVDVRPMASPLQKNGDVPLGVHFPTGARASEMSGYALTTKLSKERTKKILKALDWFYSEEGSLTRTMGLSAEQGANKYDFYKKYGMEGGVRKNGTNEWTDAMNNFSEKGDKTFAFDRMLGVKKAYTPRTCDMANGSSSIKAECNKVWNKYGGDNTLDLQAMMALMGEDMMTYFGYYMTLNELTAPTIQQYIMGKTDAAKSVWQGMVNTAKQNGLAQYKALLQKYYDMLSAPPAEPETPETPETSEE